MCDLVVEFHPEVVSFHFGLPDKKLLARVRMAGAKIISSATSVDEACWLEDERCDAIIAQGYEAGGHRGMFLTQDVSTQVGTIALVIAGGGRGVGASDRCRGDRGCPRYCGCFALGAAVVRTGTTYLLCPEAQISPIYCQALKEAKDNETAVTNVFTGHLA